MWCAMELCEPLFPPAAERQPQWEPPAPPAGAPPGPQALPTNDQYWTYGSTLLSRANVRRYGRPLCETVARCLLRRPEHRPQLAALQQTVDAQIAAGAAVSSGSRRRFREPPEPPSAEILGRASAPDPFWDYKREQFGVGWMRSAGGG